MKEEDKGQNLHADRKLGKEREREIEKEKKERILILHDQADENWINLL